MNTKEFSDKPEKKYSYLIYVITCLALITLGNYGFHNSEPNTEFDYLPLKIKLVQIFVFATVSWLIGKKYRLNYPLICGICGGGHAALISLIDIVGAFRAGYLDYEILLIDVLLIIVGFLFIGGLILVISYPFQYLFHKIRS